MGTIGKYTTVNGISLPRLRNGELLSLVQRTLDFINEMAKESERPGGLSLLSASENGVPAIGLTAEFVTQMQADVDALSERVNETTASDQTPAADVHKRNRDVLMSFILARIKQFTTLPIVDEANAGIFLWRRLSPYQNITRLPVAEETVKIRGFLLDIRKEDCTPYVAKLGLESYLTELETENEAYDAAVKERTIARALVVREDTASLRKRMHTEFNELCLLAQSYSIVTPSEEASTFILKLNQLISETNAAYNRRKGHAANSETEQPGETTEQPDTETPDVGEDGEPIERPGEL